MDSQRTTDKVPIAHKSYGGDTCARMNALLEHSYVRIYMLVGGKWYDVSKLLPIGDGWIRVYVRDAGYENEPLYFTERWNRPFALYLAQNTEEFASGTRNTDALTFTSSERRAD